MEYMSTIDLVRIDERTRSLVVLYGQEGYLEIDLAGVLIPEGGEFEDESTESTKL